MTSTEITQDLASEFQAPDRITALVRIAEALSAADVDALAAEIAAGKLST
jgi:hypothetical protein